MEIGRPKSTRALQQVVFLALQRAADLLLRNIELVLAPAGLSPTQYNVLRILRGAAQPVPCGEIAAEMITRDPDMTRLLDRLERRDLVTRARDQKDRRVVLASITQSGLELLKELDQPIVDAHREQLSHLDEDQLDDLLRLLKLAINRTKKEST